MENFLDLRDNVPSLNQLRNQRFDMHLKLQRRGADSNEYDVVDEFRISDNSDEDCVHIKGLLRTAKKGKGKLYIVFETEDDETGSLGPVGTRINDLTQSIIFLCYNSQEEDGVFYGKVLVFRKDPEEFDDEQRKKIENVLKSNKLDFFNEYLSPVAQNNPCSNEEKKVINFKMITYK
ncbi:uncharacterized protein LOC123301023 isoform X2 [Chrysoperla carnea]|uniref:uncharacterized protein LOC123301023 isoform X2 n=1 Tax=Chrysoperla carnea TaxID=189513 RepID=UPI001D0863BD|nr:uncharacterized protein LOC123301023 isoform X2 [Chrysoperla carnea]